VRIRVASEEWRSTTVESNLNPVWNTGKGDTSNKTIFMIYDVTQHIFVEVWDEDKQGLFFGHGPSVNTGDDFIGGIVPLTVDDCLRLSSQELDVIGSVVNADVKSERAVGSVRLCFEWLSLVPNSVQQGGDMCVMVRIGSVRLPKKLGDRAGLLVKIGSKTATVPVARFEEPVVATTEVTRVMEHVIHRCDEQDMNLHDISYITGLPEERVLQELGEDSTIRTRQSPRAPAKDDTIGTREISVQGVVYLCVPADLNQTLELTLIGDRKKPLGRRTEQLTLKTSSGGYVKFTSKNGPLEAELEVSVSGFQTGA